VGVCLCVCVCVCLCVLSNAIEFDTPTHTCFVDLAKAYDAVNRSALWQVLRQAGLSEKLQRLLKELHTNSHASVRAYGQLSEPFSINNGVRQGCVLAPALFNLFLDHVVNQALKDSNEGVTIRYTTNGVLHIEHRRPNELFDLVQLLLYADDMAIVCDSADGLTRLVTSLDNVTQAWHLDISQKKTKILTVDRFNSQQQPSITLRNQKIEQVTSFKYLGRHFDASSTLDTEINYRLKKASSSFWRYKTNLYGRKEISVKTKVRIFKTTALPTLLFGSEGWPILARHLRRLESFQMRCLRYSCGITFATHGKVSHESIRRRCDIRSIGDQLRINRLKWFGHVYRMDSSRLPRKALFSRLSGDRPQGGHYTTWRSLVLKDLELLHQSETWQENACDRKKWRKIIHQRPESLRSARSRSLRSSTRCQRDSGASVLIN